MLEDMDINDIVGEYKQVTLDLYEVKARKVFYTERETPYPEGKIIVSTTDAKGIITHVNHVFVEMSGYTKKALLGKNHAILRHPEMPTIIFKDLWDTVQSGKKWQGIINSKATITNSYNCEQCRLKKEQKFKRIGKTL